MNCVNPSKLNYINSFNLEPVDTLNHKILGCIHVSKCKNNQICSGVNYLLGEKVKLILKVAHDSEETMKHTTVKVYWDIEQVTLEHTNNLPN